VVSVSVPKYVTSIGGGQFSITLSQPLPANYAAAETVVTALVAAAANAYPPIGAGGYTLNADAAAGTTSISIHSTDDLTTFTNWLLELKAGAITALVTPGTVTAQPPAGSNNYTVNLASAVPFTFTAAGTTLTALNDAAEYPLDATASGGDALMFVAGGDGLPLGDLIDIDPFNAASREIRVVGNAKTTS